MKKAETTRAAKRFDFRPTKGLKFAPLEESIQMRELYIRGIRHDINGLLGPLISYTDFFSTMNEEKAARMLPRIMAFHRSSKVVLEQIAKLSAIMSNIQLGRNVDIPFDPGAELHRAVLSLTYANGSAKVSNSLKHTMSVRGNPLDIYRTFMNILINAHESLGPEGRISISSRDRFIMKVPYVSFSFDDNGRGMDAATLGAVFEPGVTTKETGQGLGLFVVQHSVATFGGILDVESEPGHGTRFTVIIPATV